MTNHFGQSKTVFAALSGGVDSSVAAALLKAEGWRVVGVHMKMWAPDAGDPVCRQQHEDRVAAMQAAAHLDIPFQTWDLSAEYRAAVVEYMIREYAAGRTPNPDVMCNREIKFGLFFNRALAAGAEYIATGHYIQKVECGRWRVGGESERQKLRSTIYALHAAVDSNKDQSYFLWTLGQDVLARCLFPLGEMTKPEVRAYARHIGLPNADKPDSQGICFIGEIDVPQFLAKYIPGERGLIKTAAGRVVGEHAGAAFYTVGQRRGLGIGGGVPYYVAEKDVATNTLVVAEGRDDAALFRRELRADAVQWVSGRAPEFPLRSAARIRYRQPVQECVVNAASLSHGSSGISPNDSMTNDSILVAFDEPQRAVAPGQSIVFYDGKRMLGGGIIAG
ncbi:tRNA 2-thiouridine(34) synthase MnmA [Candidatus Parcubacteria bacterium]|nr:MAG: tRNA 2-thiouridine(34) synthase MnmA [Candidatus Parcubacteria bacterium]